MPDLSMVVDVVDRHNRTIATVDRGSLFTKELDFRTVHVILRDKNNAVVLQQLPVDHLRSPGKLGSSAAGYLNAGESYNEAANRKLQSELGIKTQLRLEGQFQMRDEKSIKHVAVFSGETTNTPTLLSSDVSALIFMSAVDVGKTMMASPDKFTKTFQMLYATQKSLFR